MDGSIEEEQMSVEDYAKWKAAKKARFLTSTKRRYTLADLELLFTSYQQFAENYTSAYYEREIKLPSGQEWLALNK